MRLLKSAWRFIITLGGLVSNSVDETTDKMITSPEGVRSTYRAARDKWKKDFHEVRDAVAQLGMVREQKKTELEKVNKEDEEIALKKQGAVNKFKETKDPKFQEMFQRYHQRDTELDQRREQLTGEIQGLENQLDKYKRKLTQMQARIKDLDKEEAEAIADIVTSKSIIDLNDRLSGLSTDLHDDNLTAINRHREKMRAKAQISDEIAGTDADAIEDEIMAAGMSTDAMDEFNAMLGEQGLKDMEASSDSPTADTERKI